jgi:hypothetical protein
MGGTEQNDEIYRCGSTVASAIPVDADNLWNSSGILVPPTIRPCGTMRVVELPVCHVFTPSATRKVTVIVKMVNSNHRLIVVGQ